MSESSKGRPSKDGALMLGGVGVQEFSTNRVVEKIWNSNQNQCPTSTSTKQTCGICGLTIVENAQTLHFTACLLALWWEFTMDHAVHLINCTPKNGLIGELHY